MALTPSTMLPLGTQAPDFTLPDVISDKPITLSKISGKKGYLIMFICRHCPYVVHVQEELAKLDRDYSRKGIALIGISSNDTSRYPEDAPPFLREMAVRLKYQFPVCFDETQAVARAYQAACTPDFFLFDAERALIYRGQLDDSRPGNQKPVTGADLRSALDALLTNKPLRADQKPSMGCGIKWK